MSTAIIDAPVGDTEVVELPSMETSPDCGFPHDEPNWLWISQAPCTHNVVARVVYCAGSLLLCDVAHRLVTDLMARQSVTLPETNGKKAVAACGTCSKPVHLCWTVLPV